MSEQLRIKLLREGVATPERAHSGDAGFDLRTAVDFTLKPGQRDRVPTGIALELPDHLCALVLPRSGLANKHGIALVNAPGLIDSGYRGELQVLLLNTDRTESFSAKAGERIAQLVLIEPRTPELQVVEELADSERGSGGFGSSGTH